MKIKQFEDKNLSHYSYAVLNELENKIILIDPARDIKPYMDYAKEHQAVISGIIETHPHADFVSSHLELHKLTGATIYTSKLVHALYPHQTFDEGQSIESGKIKLSAINTPGHSPDSISILAEYDGKQIAVFTGDTLFIGDCGRPDLREGAGKIQITRNELARQMYHTLREKLMVLQDDVVVYPAHGAGTLCGKNLSKENSSTIKKEKQTNWSLQESSEEVFIKNLLADQPFIPLYFPFNVELNRKGAKDLYESISEIFWIDLEDAPVLNKKLWIIDTRDEEEYKQGHLPHSINLMEKGKFETWLGSIIIPGEKFYLTGESKEQIRRMMVRAAAIGYETAIDAAFVTTDGAIREAELDLEKFKNDPNAYTIVDVRNTTEVKAGKIFPQSISIPLAEIRQRIYEIPTDKNIVVHCAGGYRSAAASSIIHSELNGIVNVTDLGEAVNEFKA